MTEANINNALLVADNAKIRKTKKNAIKLVTPHISFYLEKVFFFKKTKLITRHRLGESESGLNLVDIIKQSLRTVTSSDCNNNYVDMTTKLPIAAAGRSFTFNMVR